jgi:hypothetical protein
MSEDEVQPPDDGSTADQQTAVDDPPPYAPDFELIGYLEEKEGTPPEKRRG